MALLLQLEIVGPETLPLLLITAGLLISLAEALAPGANFIVVGIGLLGAGLTGLLLSPFFAAGPFLLGILTLLFGSIAFYLYHEFDFYGGKGQQQTSDSAALQGKTGRVTERVTPTGGQVKLQGGGFNPYYSARSMDNEIPEGTDVMVIDPGGGNVVTVEALSIIEDDIDRQLAAGRDDSDTPVEPPEQDETAATEYLEKRIGDEGVDESERDPEYEQ
ncbi:membrane protein implicated in regulation of membrane protease activity [Halohasta litchfieldiae]|jgi:membrane protein implicated in regulation of membrane protease activity|uniref:Membrane protein implicated in regulation of membrane protease activity n=1 Tax=Halohasta litchfieldiae TaxID=1073996 RepID=A0A1H6RD51_9EURY|nr:NfeD family protein [Halohasta litchfieldiae]ATW89719.1 membrane protein implicated in regulation of membrane protease activity [Halohasta litchfieldiae]SEI53768.1 Membrane protein implicated in regulation of membrane protease activity [Halohasta litchfieldiae]